MTDYTMKKLWNCLVRDEWNHSNLKEAIREELKRFYDCIENDKIIDGNSYKAECWYMEDDEMIFTQIHLYNSQIAELLNSGKFEFQG